jgi:hypothetical protein
MSLREDCNNSENSVTLSKALTFIFIKLPLIIINSIVLFFISSWVLSLYYNTLIIPNFDSVPILYFKHFIAIMAIYHVFCVKKESYIGLIYIYFGTIIKLLSNKDPNISAEFTLISVFLQYMGWLFAILFCLFLNLFI